MLVQGLDIRIWNLVFETLRSPGWLFSPRLRPRGPCGHYEVRILAMDGPAGTMNDVEMRPKSTKIKLSGLASCDLAVKPRLMRN